MLSGLFYESRVSIYLFSISLFIVAEFPSVCVCYCPCFFLQLPRILNCEANESFLSSDCIEYRFGLYLHSGYKMNMWQNYKMKRQKTQQIDWLTGMIVARCWRSLRVPCAAIRKRALYIRNLDFLFYFYLLICWWFFFIVLNCFCLIFFLDITVEMSVKIVKISMELRQRWTIVDAHGPAVGHHGKPVNHSVEDQWLIIVEEEWIGKLNYSSSGQLSGWARR